MIQSFHSEARLKQPSNNYKALLVLASFFFLFYLVSSVSAEKMNTFIDVKIQCLNGNNSYCSSSAVCNLTLFDANQNTIVNNVLMTNQYSFYNYTLKPYQTLVQGTVSGSAICVDGTATTVIIPSRISFELTPSGLSSPLGYFIVIFVLVYAVAFIGFFGKNEIVTLIGGMMMISLGVYTLLSGLIDYRTIMSEIIGWWTIGLGAFFSISGGLAIINDNL